MCDRVKDQKNIHVHIEKRMFWKVLSHVFVPSSGLDENNIKVVFSCLPELDMFPPVAKLCLWYMCFCAEVVFFCSHTVLLNGA